MPKPDNLSILGLYGKRDFFEHMLQEGYTRVAFGKGPQIDGERVVGMFVFYHPDGRVSTQETWKGDVSRLDPTKMRGYKQETYKPKEFRNFVSKMRIGLSERKSLLDVVKEWG